MRIHFYKIFLLLVFLFATALVIISCGRGSNNIKRSELEYTICTETELPDELKVMIEERKEKEFQLVYENSAYCYLAVGYGRQKNDNYVVDVKDFYESEEQIILDTILISSSKADTDKTGYLETCPYIVIRCAATEKPASFK